MRKRHGEKAIEAWQSGAAQANDEESCCEACRSGGRDEARAEEIQPRRLRAR